MKRSVLICLVVTVLVAICAVGCNTMHMDEDERYQRAEDRIQELIASEAYVEGSLHERSALVKELLVELESEHAIKHWYYNELNYSFSYEYANGIYGGLRVKDFATQPGELPMN